MANRFLSNIRINDAYTLPASDGTTGQVIVTDGAGGLSFSDVSAGSDTVVYQDNFTGDNSTVNFTLAQSVDNEIKTFVFLDGVYQFKDTYSINNNILTFTTAPTSATSIEVITIASAAAEDYNQKMLFYGKATEAISKGDAIMLGGQEGDHFLLSKATQTAIAANHEYFLGLASQDLSIGEFGYVTEFGRIDQIDTTVWTAGDILWFDAGGSTAGALTITEPAAPLAKIQVAAVIREHQNEGVLFVRPTWYHELGELHDVNITSVADKDMLVWNNTNEYWENTKTLGDITATSLNVYSSTVDANLTVQTIATGYDARLKLIANSSGFSQIRFEDEADANVGLLTYAHSDNSMQFRTNDSERMRIDSSGNVGIGTSSPLGKIHSHQGASGQLTPNVNANGLVIEDNASNGISILTPSSQIGSIFFGDQDDNFIGGFRYDHSNNSLATYVNNSERLRVDSSGNVIVGSTTANNVNATTLRQDGTAHVNNVQLANAAGSVGGTTPSIYSPAGGQLAISLNSAERLRINGSGNVGIGTSSPAYKLEVSESSTSPVSLARFINSSTASTTAKSSVIVLGNTDTVGTKKDVVHLSTALEDANAVNGGLLIATRSGDSIAERLRITSSGNIQHSFNPGGGTYYWQDTTNGASMFYLIPATYTGTAPYNSNRIVAANSSYIGLETGGAERVTIMNDGQVRINSTQGASTNTWPLRVEAGNGGTQARFTRLNAYADIFMGGTDSNATQLFVRSGGINGVRLDYAATSWVSASDINLKNINNELTGVLPKLQNIRAVNFSWKEDESNKENLGVIAQDVESEFPQLVSVSEIDGMKGVKYTEFVPILIAAIKEQQDTIEDLKARIEILENN